jgi:hypothetical protein
MSAARRVTRPEHFWRVTGKPELICDSVQTGLSGFMRSVLEKNGRQLARRDQEILTVGPSCRGSATGIPKASYFSKYIIASIWTGLQHAGVYTTRQASGKTSAVSEGTVTHAPA